jgi:hypothetical protein
MKITGIEIDFDNLLLLIEQRVHDGRSGVPAEHQTRMYLLSLSREKLHRLELASILKIIEESVSEKEQK